MNLKRILRILQSIFLFLVALILVTCAVVVGVLAFDFMFFFIKVVFGIEGELLGVVVLACLLVLGFAFHFFYNHFKGKAKKGQK